MDRAAQLNASFEGKYRIERELGSGGMATVYLAEDLKHHRRVAIKVLRDDLSASVGAERFLREIEIAAHLQHPNILPLLDSGEAGGRLFYVMPFVEGQSLRDRLAREHELPVSDAIRLLVEIVDALAYAHARGVVHRDIKPDNVMLSGRHGLIADFGVARAISNATNPNSITSLGVALGTPAYMSPEQATADPTVDHRTDIYAVGVLAYELIGGTVPFAGTSPQKVLAAHVMETPAPLSRHRPGISPALEQIVMQCLAKRPADRWQRTDDLLAALEPLATPTAGLAPTSPRLEPVRTRRSLLVPLGIAALVIAGGAFAYRAMRHTGPSLAFGASTQLTTDAGLQIHPALSPDGKFVAYAAGTSSRMRIFIQPLIGGRVIPLSDDTTALQYDPSWSADGTQILALTNGGVSIAPALGGTMRPVIAPAGGFRVRAADWSPDGREIAYVRGDSLMVQPLDGTPARFATTGLFSMTACRWQPRGRLVACVSGNGEAFRPGPTFGNVAPSAIVLLPVDGGTMRAITDRKSLHQSPVWSADGRRLYYISDREGTRDIYERAIGRDGDTSGAELRLTTGLNAHSLSIAGSHAVYSVYSSRANIWTLPIPASGVVSAETATALTNAAQTVESVQPSNDGKWLVFDATRSGRSDLYRMPATGGAAERVVHEPFDVFVPALSPDGRLLAYHSWRNGTRDIEVKPLDGGPVEIVTNSPLQESYPRWSPDGRSLVFTDLSSGRILVADRMDAGRWSKPRDVGIGIKASWISNSEVVFIDADASSIRVTAATGSGRSRMVYAPGAGPADPRPELVTPSADRTQLFFKTHDTEGRASFWRIPAAGGMPQLLVQFPNPLRRSNRTDFAVDSSRFLFTIEDQQSNIWAADITAP
jgi:Tol biopolymer transport system component/tRNA A-37 threonylcarbamoyl transferase component Bud32